MRVIFLGTNGWYDSPTGNTCSVLIDAAESVIVLDAGFGLSKLDQYARTDRPVHLFLSHFHLDHIAGLHVLTKFRIPEGLTIYGQPGTTSILDRVVAEPFTIPLQDLPYPVRVEDLAEGDYTKPFPLSCRFLVHASPCMGFRMEIEGKTIAYLPDTGYCPNAVLLARGADLVITECALRPGEHSVEWPHLNPETAVRIAREAGAARLALMHFDAVRYPSHTDRRLIAREYQGSHPEVYVTFDEMAVHL
ncbi:MAG: MBL fold metallo-hydrolase [Methanomicrobiales archaeon]|jgi:ribonuclease BN (tRNA processing enzyme)|nr:MBL fold metallo-hydrolase [Methanomicrobiales archaeon]